ncbi:MAG: UDP-N-acetylmuramyl-tripeptide synthetase [Candidatus Pacebacteria bacterium]|nr:UDP-N-acetylmuramyl-tripeptide synthetase [Candidatus Paceibacterota bacterium]MBP9866702.1 UDP-N-acetylmuramyl-tripeptide synthetase [Candidatus Paceibacterota bacterium]
MEKILRTTEKIIPRKVYKALQPYYHFTLALLGTIIYRKPSRHIYVIGITGTKGKSSTTEFVSAALEGAGKKTAILSTIRFKVGDTTRPNKFKMTMPGRFFTQKFLRDAVDAGCEYAIIEMTSEGARFFRHTGVEMDALIFTNLSPEHIESHGSFEKYKKAKLRLVKHLSKSKKPIRLSIANIDNEHAYSFLTQPIEKNIGYSLKHVRIISETSDSSIIDYKGNIIVIPLPGKFNISNALAALSLAQELGLSINESKKGIESLSLIRGRVEKIECGQDFTVIVDYAHTDDSLRKLYETFDSSRKIAVLGSTGGGRDGWKRPVLGKIADEYCNEIIITNEDPYDEDPLKIINEVASGVTTHTPHIIVDRRQAIAHAISLAKTGDTILITGKGTDPYIMGPSGTKEIWDDATVTREELQKRLS